MRLTGKLCIFNLAGLSVLPPHIISKYIQDKWFSNQYDPKIRIKVKCLLMLQDIILQKSVTNGMVMEKTQIYSDLESHVVPPYENIWSVRLTSRRHGLRYIISCCVINITYLYFTLQNAMFPFVVTRPVTACWRYACKHASRITDHLLGETTGHRLKSSCKIAVEISNYTNTNLQHIRIFALMTSRVKVINEITMNGTWIIVTWQCVRNECNLDTVDAWS